MLFAGHKLKKLALLLLSLSFFHSAQAYEKVYVVGVEALNYYPLYRFEDDKVNLPSFAHDLFHKFFTSHGYKFRFQPLPIRRFNQWYQENQIDFRFPDNADWLESTTKSKLTFSEPVNYVVAGTFVLKQNRELKREQIDSLVTMTGYYPTFWIDRIKAGSTSLIETGSTLSVVKHVLLGNVKATNVEPSVLNHRMKELGREGEIVLNENIFHQRYPYYLSSNKYPEIIDQFNKFLVKEAGFVAKLKQKYQLVENF